MNKKIDQGLYNYFLELTRVTICDEWEDATLPLIFSVIEKSGYKFYHSEENNVYCRVGDSPTTAFMSHLDTVASKLKVVHHVIDEENGLISTDGKTILGADDKAGVALMLRMIENHIPGYYFFYTGEERGCVGSSAHVKALISSPMVRPVFNKAISFDRYGYDSVITFQKGVRCCSEEFTKALCDQLNTIEGFKFAPDDGGVFTDSATWMHCVPEVTNLSVGYQHHHSVKEVQDILFLSNLLEAVKQVDWETLPVVRNPKIIERRKYTALENSTKNSKAEESNGKFSTKVPSFPKVTLPANLFESQEELENLWIWAHAHDYDSIPELVEALGTNAPEVSDEGLEWLNEAFLKVKPEVVVTEGDGLWMEE